MQWTSEVSKKDRDEIDNKCGKPSADFIYKEEEYIETVENHIYFYSDIDREKVLQLNKTIRDLNIRLSHEALMEDRVPANIYLHLSTFGGSMFSGLSSMDEILKSKIPIHTIIDGQCASAGTFISIVGKKRFINKHAYMLIHQLRSLKWGKYEEFEDELKNLNRFMNMIKGVYKEFTNIPMGKLNEILKHDLWFDSKECLEYGLVDEIL